MAGETVEPIVVTTYGNLINGNGKHDEVTNLKMGDLGTVMEKWSKFRETAQTIIDEADVYVASWDVDGVLVNEYIEETGAPIFEDEKLRFLDKHVDRMRCAAESKGKSTLHILNTNREVSIVADVMDHIDPHGKQSMWAGVLEGGHVIAYRTYFDSSKIIEKNGKRFVTLPDDSQAEIVRSFDDGSHLVAEDLLDRGQLNELTIGKDVTPVRAARLQLSYLFQQLTGDGTMGASAWIPEGRMGMVTARRVSPDFVETRPEVDLEHTKKHYVTDPDSPIMRQIRDVLQLEDGEQFPFKVVYYPFDGGLDIEFGLNKQFGQEMLFQRLRQLGMIDDESKVAVAHIGDSGSDAISLVVPDGSSINTAVVAVGNADSALVSKANLQVVRPAQRGAMDVVYNYTKMIRHSKPKTTLEGKEFAPGRLGLSHFVESYLGRTPARERDIDIAEVLKRASVEDLQRIQAEITRVRNGGGRVFVYGNGGSFDNARLIAETLKGAGIDATTPGDNSLYKRVTKAQGFGHIFVEALKAEGFTDRDMVIGISGSGTSPNVLLAHDYAQRVRIEGKMAAIQALANQGYTIDTSYLEMKTLAEDPNAADDAAKALTLFESSLQTALAQAQEKNDTDAIGTISQIIEAKTVVSLGGRDGGKMKLLTGESVTHIAPTPCMEALEDEHPIVMAAVAQSIQSGLPVGESLASMQKLVETMRQDETLSRIKGFAEAMEKTILRGGRVIIVGDTDLHPSVTHAHADWGRGMINMLPINGPEISIVDGNINATMATGNDDGANYGYVDTLGKMKLGKDDIVVFIGGSEDQKAFELCMNEVAKKHVQTFVVGTQIGERSADISLEDTHIDLGATMLTHTISRAVNEHMRSPDGLRWLVREAKTTRWSPETQQFIAQQMGTQRKLNRADTLALEDMLRGEDRLPDGYVITWCYGKPYVALDPGWFGLERGFY